MTNAGGTWFLTILFKQKHCWLRLNRTQRVLYGGKKDQLSPKCQHAEGIQRLKKE